MPYNNAPISPPEEITGTSALPLARVKKIIAQDEEIAQCSNSAAFAISVATELFIRYLTEQSHKIAKSERKPRRTIAYKDVAAAVSRIDNLEFLSDIVPRTKPFKEIARERERLRRQEDHILSMAIPEREDADRAAEKNASGGFMTTGSRPGTSNGVYDPMERNLQSGSRTGGVPDRTVNHHHASSGGSHHLDPVRDIEMSG